MEGIFLGIGLAIHILGLHKEGYIELFVEGLIIGVVGLHTGQVLQIHPVEITVSMINRILAGPVLLPLHFRADGSEPEVQIALITAHGHCVDRSAACIGIHGVIGHTVQRCQVSVHTHFHALQTGGQVHTAKHQVIIGALVTLLRCDSNGEIVVHIGPHSELAAPAIHAARTVVHRRQDSILAVQHLDGNIIPGGDGQVRIGPQLIHHGVSLSADGQSLTIHRHHTQSGSTVSLG